MGRRKGFVGALALLCVFCVLAFVRPGDVFGDWLDSLKVAQTAVNDDAARAHLKAFVTACEAFKAAHDRYPKDEDELLNPEEGPGYISQNYDGQEIMGYEYSVQFKDEGYQLIAKPVKCKESGSKIFIIESGKETMELDCK